MVVDRQSEPEAAEVDSIFHALSAATRRDILRRCSEAEPSVSKLAESYPISFAAVQKHVAVLERAGLVVKRRSGREQLVTAEPDALRHAREAIDALEQLWRGRVGRMTELLGESDHPNDTPPKRSKR